MWTVITEARTDDPVARLGTLVNLDLGEVVSALLDAWAVAGDVLSFHQERIAAEARLETAERRRSLDLLARTVGYVPEQHLSATTTLAMVVDPKRADELKIPARTRFEALPVDDSPPQIFETVRDVKVHAKRNLMTLAFDFQPLTKHSRGAVFVGTDLGLAAGSYLVFFDETNKANIGGIQKHPALRVVLTSVEERQGENQTSVTWGETLGKLWTATWNEGSNVPEWPWDGRTPAPATITGPFNLFGREAPLWNTLPIVTKRDILGGSPALEAIRDDELGNVNNKPQYEVLVGRKLLQDWTVPQKTESNDQIRKGIINCVMNAFIGTDGRDEWRGFEIGMADSLEISGECPSAQPGAWVLIEGANGKITASARVKGRSTRHGQKFMLSETITALTFDSGTLPAPPPALSRRDDRLFVLGRKFELARTPDPRPLMARRPTVANRKKGVWVTVNGLHPWLEPGSVLLARGFAPVARFRKGTALRPENSGNRPQDHVLVRAVKPTRDTANPDDFTWRGGNPRLGRDTVWWGSENDFEFESPPAEAADTAPSIWREAVAVKLEVKETFFDDDGEYTTIVFKDSPGKAIALAGLTLYGNLIEVVNAETVKEEVVVDRGRHPLARLPLAHHRSRPGMAPVPDLELIDADAQTVTGHRVVAFSSGKATVTFGEAAPDRLTATYRVSGGAAGNLPPGHIVNPPDGIPAITEVFQHLPALGGIGEPDLTDLRRRIPLATTDLGRLVTEEDFRTFALRFPGVTKADVFLDNQQVIVSIGTRDGAPVATDPLLRKLKEAMGRAMADMRTGGEKPTVTILPCRMRPFAVELTIHYQDGADRRTVDDAVKEHIAAAFHYHRRGIGQSVTYQEIKNSLAAVPGCQASTINLRFVEDEEGKKTLLADKKPTAMAWLKYLANAAVAKGSAVRWMFSIKETSPGQSATAFLQHTVISIIDDIYKEDSSHRGSAYYKTIINRVRNKIGKGALAGTEAGHAIRRAFTECATEYAREIASFVGEFVVTENSPISIRPSRPEAINRLRLFFAVCYMRSDEKYKQIWQVHSKLDKIIDLSIRRFFYSRMASFFAPSYEAIQALQALPKKMNKYPQILDNKQYKKLTQNFEHGILIDLIAYVNTDGQARSVLDNLLKPIDFAIKSHCNLNSSDGICGFYAKFPDPSVLYMASRHFRSQLKSVVLDALRNSSIDAESREVNDIISNYTSRVVTTLRNDFPLHLCDMAPPEMLEDTSLPPVKMARWLLGFEKDLSTMATESKPDSSLGGEMLVVDPNSIRVSPAEPPAAGNLNNS